MSKLVLTGFCSSSKQPNLQPKKKVVVVFPKIFDATYLFCYPGCRQTLPNAIAPKGWFCQTTEQERKDIDRAAKVWLRIIYVDSYCGFDNWLLSAKMLRLTGYKLKGLTGLPLKLLVKPSSATGFSRLPRRRPTLEVAIMPRSMKEYRPDQQDTVSCQFLI